MCGIFICEGQNELALKFVREKLRMMIHRGPDKQNTLQVSGMTLGVARLAIVQTKSGAQPHVTAKKRVVMLNGELYNYRDLCASVPLGAVREQSEVEFLGDCLDRGIDPRLFIDGDYAIAYYDPTWKHLTLYRDRFGVVPLYYQRKGVVMVSSERRRLADPIELLAGERVVIDIARKLVVSKDRIPVALGVTCTRSPAAASMVRSLMRDAVRSRVEHADDRVSVALSGGLDSTLLAHFLDTNKVRELITVTMNLKSPETVAARATAKSLGWHAKHKVVLIGKDDIDHDSSKIITHLLDGAPRTSSTLSPLRWTGAVRLWFAANACASKVLVGGDGLDEMIGGYRSHFDGAKTQLDVAMNAISSLRSMAGFNLDRANKMCMAHSVEYRPPFLSHALANYLMSLSRSEGKRVLRQVLQQLTGSDWLDDRPKYYEDDKQFAATFPQEGVES